MSQILLLMAEPHKAYGVQLGKKTFSSAEYKILQKNRVYMKLHMAYSFDPLNFRKKFALLLDIDPFSQNFWLHPVLVLNKPALYLICL